MTSVLDYRTVLIVVLMWQAAYNQVCQSVRAVNSQLKGAEHPSELGFENKSRVFLMTALWVATASLAIPFRGFLI